MFCDLIINGFPELVNFFNKLDLSGAFNKAKIKHMMAFIVAMLLEGYRGKLVQVSDFSLNTSRTPVTRFLNNKKWDEAILIDRIHSHAIAQIWEKSIKTGLPVYAIFDDTIAEKTVPSSWASNPTIAGCGFHHSHLKKKNVYGQQFVTCMLQCGDLVLPYDTVLYDKTQSKIEIVKNLISALPYPVSQGFVLADSWFACEDLFKMAKSRHFGYIGGLKTNRLIFPKHYEKNGIQIQEFVATLNERDFDIVTVKGRKYWAYTYAGKINGLKKAKVIITYPIEAFRVRQALNAFVSTQADLFAKNILDHYSKRWPIEVFFREANRHLGMKQCQARSLSAVKRYQYMVLLCYLFCGLEVKGETLNFSKARLIHQETIEKFKMSWIYQQAKENVPIEKIFAEFKWIA